MSNETVLAAKQTLPTAFDRWCRKMFLAKIAGLKYGCLNITDDYGTRSFSGAQRSELVAEVRIKDFRTYRLIVMRGALGGAEAYMAGLWESQDLYSFIRLMALNQNVLTSFEGGLAVLQRPVEALMHYLSRNTLTGSEKNIRAHYDLSNDLFKLFLDSKMMYSCAYFKSPAEDLEAAAENKLRLICDKMQLKASDSILEIGTGWGGFAVFAAENYGCHVTTTTISKEQHDYARELIAKKGLEDRVELLFKDYRLLSGQYDKVVSIEMIEAVGADFLDTYIGKCSELLKDDGALFIQAITINDQIYERALKEVDFIKKYIFPGSFIPAVGAIVNSATAASDLRLYHFQDLTPHYAQTLLAWRQRFLARRRELSELGFDQAFIRRWDYYFCYCAGGFSERSIGSTHFIFGKPLYRGDLGKVAHTREG